MRFLAITGDLSVCKDEILAIRKDSNGLAVVILESGEYLSNFPYETILGLLEMPNIEEKVKEKMSLQEAYQRPQQFFWG